MNAELLFRAMGSEAHVVVVGGRRSLAEEARLRIASLERRWSRFLPQSEVNVLTDHAGTFVPVSPETALLVGRAIEAWRITGGLFDPTVLGDVIRAGYDRTFEDVDGAAASSPLVIGCTDIQIDGWDVRLPPGTGFDAGGIGKGLAADLVAAETMAAGADGVCINLGGDLRVHGAAPDGHWTVAVEHPSFDQPILHIGLDHGGVASSTTLKRRWTTDGHARHHLIDPQTGQPSTTDLTFATVIAAEAWIAEVLAKAVVLRGALHPFDLLDERAVALVVDREGRIAMSEGFEAFAGTTT